MKSTIYGLNIGGAIYTLPAVGFFHIGDVTRKLREARGWTVVQLANEAGVNKMTISAVENGEDFRVSSLDKIALALQTTKAEMYRYLQPDAPANELPTTANKLAGVKKDAEVTPPVSGSGVQDVYHRGPAPGRTPQPLDGGPHGSDEGVSPSHNSTAPLPPDDEIIGAFRQHARFIHAIVARLLDYAVLIEDIVAAFDAGEIRSDRTPPAPTTQHDRGDHRPPAPPAHRLKGRRR